jgi:2,3-bisphosphoglycerate-independent phosphoglycerate mutase
MLNEINRAEVLNNLLDWRARLLEEQEVSRNRRKADMS